MIFAISQVAWDVISDKDEFSRLEDAVVRMGIPALYEQTSNGRVWRVYADPRIRPAHLRRMRDYLLARGATQTQIDQHTYHSVDDVIPPAVEPVTDEP